MATQKVLKSVVVQRLANLASEGRYSVTPNEARLMNALFVLVAEVINDLEAEESADPIPSPEDWGTGEKGEDNDS